MSLGPIPIKNFNLEKEAAFLEEKVAQGWKLTKVGRVFYHFETCSPAKKSCQINLVDQKVGFERSKVELVEKAVGYQKMKKVYRFAQEDLPEVLDSELRLAYYDHYRLVFSRLASFAIFPILLAFALLTASVSIPSIVLYLALVLSLLFVPLIRLSLVCEKAVCEMTHEQGRLTGFEANYIIDFKNISPETMTDLVTEMKKLGMVKQTSERILRIQSALSKEELTQFLLEHTTIESENFSLMHIGEMYVLV